jgi:hypothetical protein
VLAELLGNSPANIRKHYAHLCLKQEAIREQLERFKASGERKRTPSASGRGGPPAGASGPEEG